MHYWFPSFLLSSTPSVLINTVSLHLNLGMSQLATCRGTHKALDAMIHTVQCPLSYNNPGNCISCMPVGSRHGGFISVSFHLICHNLHLRVERLEAQRREVPHPGPYGKKRFPLRSFGIKVLPASSKIFDMSHRKTLHNYNRYTQPYTETYVHRAESFTKQYLLLLHLMLSDISIPFQ